MADDTNPTNLNKSPSPGGDGVQSSSAEKRAAGADEKTPQGAQQRINQAERREAGETGTAPAATEGRSGLVQTPGEVLPSTGPDPIDVAEQNRKDKAAAEQALHEKNLPQATIDELNAGKDALKNRAGQHGAELREAPRTNPVDATEAAAKPE